MSNELTSKDIGTILSGYAEVQRQANAGALRETPNLSYLAMQAGLVRPVDTRTR